MQPFKHSQIIHDVEARNILQTLEDLLPANAFSVLHVHDVHSTLQKKGLEREPYYIVEFCRAPAAHAVLSADPDIGLFLPCKFLVIQQGKDVRVSAFLPTAIETFFPGLNLLEIAESIERDILAIMEKLT